MNAQEIHKLIASSVAKAVAEAEKEFLIRYKAKCDENAQLKKIIEDQNVKIKNLEHELFVLKKKVFGSNSEKDKSAQGEEAKDSKNDSDAEEAREEDLEKEIEVQSYTRRKKKKGIQIPKDIKVIEEHYYPDSLTEEEREKSEEFPPVVSEELCYIPSSIFLKKHIRHKFLHKNQFHTGQLPATVKVLDKCIAGTDLLSHILTSKYCDHLPLNRQEEMLKRQGICIPRSTLCNWVKKSAELLEPIYKKLCEEVCKSNYIHADETVLQIRCDKKYKKGYLWSYLSNNIVVYEYTGNRSKTSPSSFLNKFKGYLQTDGYSGYDEVCSREDIIRAGCWDHARRKFVELEDSDTVFSKEILKDIQKLYKIEKSCKGLSEEEIVKQRKESKSQLEIIHAKLETKKSTVLPKSPTFKAINYVLNQWSYLLVYLSHGFIDISNIKIERLIRYIAIGRKNYLFAGSEEGARWATIIYSLINSCRLVKVDPFFYLDDVLKKVNTLPSSRINELFPENWRELQKKAPP